MNRSRDMRLDTEFGQHLMDIKPFLHRLQYRSDRRKCALWIRKLCEPTSSSLVKKNRNLYTRLMLLMLKRGDLNEPFISDPDSGPLSELPSYMSILLDDTKIYSPTTKANEAADSLAEWAENELTKSLHPSYATEFSQLNISDGGLDQNFHSEYRADINKEIDRSFSPDVISFRDEEHLSKMQEKEFKVKTKLSEAKFHEEKLQMQQQHDSDVQKILERKNDEINDLKRDWKKKELALEESKRKLEKRVQSYSKEIQSIRDTKARRVGELQSQLEETKANLRAEYESKIDQMTTENEKEKYELQKIHTKHIQELLDETNQRLANMEKDYTSQSQTTKVIISDLEDRVLQLKTESESMLITKQELIATNQRLENDLEISHSNLETAITKHERLDKEFRDVRKDHEDLVQSLISKHASDVEFMKEEYQIMSSEHQKCLHELEDQVQASKHALQDSEQRRISEVRECKSVYQEKEMEAKREHEKQIHDIRAAFEIEKSQNIKRISSLEELLKEREKQVTDLGDSQAQAFNKAQDAIESFKKQASEAQERAYGEMKVKMEDLKMKLEKSEDECERLTFKHQNYIQELLNRHRDEKNALKEKLDREKDQIIQAASNDLDTVRKEHEKQIKSAELRFRQSFQEQERVIDERQKQQQAATQRFEDQIKELRKDIVSANNLRRQQLVELGLLREEERQKMQRESDLAISQLEKEMNRQREEQLEKHSIELEKQSNQMKMKVDQLEMEYKSQLERAHERLNEAQKKEKQLGDEFVNECRQIEKKSSLYVCNLEKDYKRQQMENEEFIQQLKENIEDEKQKVSQMKRQLQMAEFDAKDKLTLVKLEYEERIKDLMPKSVKLDYEEIVKSLKCQVQTLQKKVNLLEDSAYNGSFDDNTNPLKINSAVV